MKQILKHASGMSSRRRQGRRKGATSPGTETKKEFYNFADTNFASTETTY